MTNQDLQNLAPDNQDTGTPTYFLRSDQSHSRFSAAIPPILRVPAGAIVTAETNESSDKQLSASSTTDQLAYLTLDRVHPLVGPVYVNGAQPGDILAVTLLDVKTLGWGWTAIFPGFGTLQDEFGEPYLKTFEFDETNVVSFSDQIKIPLRPFPGVMGVAPATSEELSTMPPRENGGNMDDPDIGVGTTIYFPVFVEGGLFSIGDGHAVQGRGEVGGPALETPIRVTYKLDVIKGQSSLPEPRYENDTYMAVMASDPTLDGAARKATRYMVDMLESDQGLTREDAYVLCSLAADLMVNELPNKPNVSVTMRVRKDIFGHKS